MLEKRHFHLGLNTDDEDRLLQDGEYRFALNVRNGSAEGADVGAITNTLGNTLINFQLPGGRNQVIGSFEDLKGNRVFYFLFNSNDRHQILEYSIGSNSINLVIESEFLNFNTSFPVWHVNIVSDDIIFWTDKLNEPSQIIVSRVKKPLSIYFQEAEAINGNGPNLGFVLPGNTLSVGDIIVGSAFDNPDYNGNLTVLAVSGPNITVDAIFVNISPFEKGLLTQNPDGYPSPFTRQYLDVIKYPPLCPPTIVYSQNPTIPVNSLAKARWQVKYRYVYIDNSKSSWSPISKISIREYEGTKPDGSSATLITPPEYYANELNITLESGDFYVKEIEVAARESAAIFGLEASGDFFLIETIDRRDIPGSTTVVKFLNDKIYASIGLNDSNKLFDRVPLQAGAQSVIDGNLLAYGSITENIDVDPVDVSLKVITNTEAGSVIDIFSGFDGNDEVVRINTITLTAPQLFHLEVTVGSQLFAFFIQAEAGTDPRDVMLDFIDQINNDPDTAGILNAIPVNLGGGVFKFILNPLIQAQVNSTVGTFVTPKLSFKKGAAHEFGMIYTDKAGRVTSIRTSDDMVIQVPWYDDLPAGQKGVVNMELTIRHDAPPEATHYQIMYTQNQSVGRFLQILNDPGAIPLGNNRFSIKLNQVAFWGNQFPGSSVSYDFAEGDRFRIYRANSGFPNNVKDVPIIAFNSGTNSIIIETTDPNIAGQFFEIYTPRKELDTGIFFEIGECFEVIDGKHQGNVQNQTTNDPGIVLLENGDVYVVNRLLLDAGGNEQFTGPQNESQNISDLFLSGHANEGRPNLVDASYRKITREATVYVSEAFIDDTNINGLSTFYGFSFPGTPARAKDFDKTWGSIQKLYAEDKALIMFQELKVGRVLVNESVVFDANGVPSLTKSNEILSDIIYYKGEFGIAKSPGSFAVYGQRIYFTDTNRGAVLRLSQNGITEISENQMHNFFTDTFKEVIASPGTPFLLGVYDKKFDEYILHIQKRAPLEGVYGTAQGGALTFITVPPEFADDITGVSQVTITYTNNITGLVETSTVPTTNVIGNVNLGLATGEAGSLPDGVLVQGDPITIESILVPSGGDTIAFNEKRTRWTTFYSYIPEIMVSAGTDILTFKDGALYRHNENSIRNNFYGEQFSSIMELVFNADFSTRKFWLALTEETNKIWAAISITNQRGQKTNLIEEDFEEIEDDFYAEILQDENTPVDKPLIEGDDMRSHELKVRLENKDTDNVKMIMVGAEAQASERTNK